MHALMNIQTALLTECLIIYFTGIMALTIVFMLYQNILVTERLITHITNIRALIMYAFKLDQTTLVTV